MNTAGKIILRSLELENFLSHRRTSIEFEQGVTAFVGHTGAGKSSIIDAIYFALRGDSRRGTVSNLINDQASSARVRLAMNIGGVEVVVERSLRKRTGGRVQHEALLAENGRYTARGAQPVSRRIAELLGIPHRSIDKVMIIAQGEVTRLLTEERSERMRILDSVLGLDSYEEAYLQMRDLDIPVVLEGMGMPLRFRVSSRALAKEIGEARSAIREKIKEKDRRIEELREEERTLREEARRLEESLGKLELQLNEADKRLARLEELHKAYAGMMGKREAYEKRLRELEEMEKEALEKLREAKEILKEIHDLRPLASARDVLERLNHLRQEETALEKLRASRLARLQEIAAIKDKMRRLEERYEGRIAELALSAERLEEQLKKLEEMEKEVRQEASKLQERRRILSQRKDSLEHKRAEMIREALLILKKRPTTPEEALEALLKLLRELDTSRKRLEEERRRLREEIGGIETMIKDAEEKIRLLSSAKSDRCPLCGSPLTPQHRDRVLGKLRGERERLKERLGVLRETLSQVEEKERRLEEEIRRTSSFIDGMRRRVKEYVEELGRIVAEEQDVVERLETLNARLKELVEAREKVEKQLRLAREAREDFELYRHLRDSLRPGEPEIIEKEVEDLGSRLEAIRQEESEIRRALVMQLGRSIGDAEIQGLLERARRAYSRLKELERVADEEKRLEEQLRGIREERERLEEALRGLEKEMGKLLEEGYSEEAYNEARETAQRLRSQVEGAKTRLEDLRHRLEDLESRLAEEKRLLGKLQEDLSRLEEVGFKLRVLTYIREKVFHRDYAPSRIRKRVLLRVEAMMRELLDKFNLAYSDVRVGEDFSIRLLAPNGVYRSAEMLSGGEKVSVAIAALLALHRVAMGDRLGFLIMDEPTIHLDAERRRHLIELLQAFRGGGIIPQLIIVTHDEDVRDASDHVYEVRATRRGSIVEPLGGE